MTAIASPFVVDATSVTGWPAADGVLIERAVLGAHTGAAGLEQSVLELESGRSCSRNTRTADELLFVLSGHGTLTTGTTDRSLEPDSGAYIPRGHAYALSAPEDEELLIVSVRVPGPVDDGGAPAAPALRRLADQAAAEVSDGRWFRVLFDAGTGLRSATQFVGYIPPGPARDHFHTYDEVIYVLDGEGSFDAGGESWPLGSGSCIALPARTVHRLENTGRSVLRVLAVMRPAGSPAAAYFPGGAPAWSAGTFGISDG